jgi:putative transposase
MIGLEDRRSLARDIEAQAHQAGARCTWPASRRHRRAHPAALEGPRWPGQRAMAAQACGPTPGHALSRPSASGAAVANEPRFADMPPARIVPMLADEGVYLASESSFSRVLRAQGQNHAPRAAKAPRQEPAADHARGHRAAPGVVLGHDLPAGHGGRALVLPVPDPGPVQPQDRGLGGARRDDADHAAHLVKRTALAEGIARDATSPCCTATTAPRSRPPRCWRCCTGWASSPRTRARA